MFRRRRPRLVVMRPARIGVGKVPEAITVIATRAPGEYVLKIGATYYMEREGRRYEIDYGRVVKLLAIPGNDWEPRRPSTPYPTDDFTPDYHREPAPEPTEEEFWERQRELNPGDPSQEWADPVNPGRTKDGKLHLIGAHGEVGPEWDESWDDGEDPLDPPSTRIRSDP